MVSRHARVCPVFFEITNHQHLWIGLNDFVDCLHVVIYMLLDIHWSYKNMRFWVGIVRQGLSANQIARCCKLKILEANQFAGFFTLDLFGLLILKPGIDCCIVTFSRLHPTMMGALPFRILVDRFTIFNSNPMQHLRWSSLCQMLANWWRLMTDTGVLYQTLS